MSTAFDESDGTEAPDPPREALSLLRASIDAMLDPHVLVEASRDSDGEIVEFVYRDVNQALCDYLGLSREQLLGCGIVGTTPGVMASGLFAAAKRCLETGEPLILDDYSYDNEILSDTRRYDIRATRATPTSIAVTWRDVTDRFETAQRILKSEEEYRLLAENVGDVVCRLRDDTIIWVSKSAEHILGAPPAHWIGRKAADFVVAVDQTVHQERVDDVAHGNAVSGRTRIVTAAGTEHWAHMHVKPFIDSDGNPDGALATFRLIDSEVAADQALEEARREQARSDERFRRTINHAPVGMCLVTPEGRLHNVNEAMGRFFGLDAQTMNGTHWQDFTAYEYVDEEENKLNGILEGRTDSYRMTKQYVRTDGHRIWGDLSVSCLRSPAGDVESFIAQITDVTREVSLAQRLQVQTDRLTSGLRSAAAYVSSILPGDLDGQVQVSSRYLPSQELSGDCFDYRWIDEDHLIAYLIDVSGHGIEAALLAVSVHNLLRSGSLPLPTLRVPAEVLAELNRLFQMDRHDGNYLTMWFGVYEVSSRTLRYAGAGHPPAIAVCPDASSTELSTDGKPLGMFDDTVYTSCSYTVVPGCRVLLYSDGAYEDARVEGRELSRTDIQDLFTGLAGSPLDDLVETLRGLTPSGTFGDDCSLVRLDFT